MEESQIFTDYLALGYFSDHVPLRVVYQPKLKLHYIITAVGKSYHVYGSDNLKLVRVCEPLKSAISCIMAHANTLVVAEGSTIHSFDLKNYGSHEFVGHSCSVHTLIPFADHFISIDSSSHVIVWYLGETDVQSQKYLEFDFTNSTFEITAAVQPLTYLNKVLFGSTQGRMRLWNIRINKLIHEFSGWEHPITIMKQAPAVDVIGIGLASGHIHLHNLKYDETVMTFKQDWGAVVSLTFRTDGQPVMVTGSTVGHMAVWNLESKQIASQIRDAHNDSVTGLECLHNEPIMISSSADNSVKMWMFDQSDGGARLLRERQGHSLPVIQVRFYDDQTVLSVGQDNVMFKWFTERLITQSSLGKAYWDKKRTQPMPVFTGMSCQRRRGQDWHDIIAIHAGTCVPTLWCAANSVPRQLLRDLQVQEIPKCTAISPCGNFAIIGFDSGDVEIVNMQSRQSRGIRQGEHSGPIRGVAVDLLTTCFISAGADGKVIVWNFKSEKPENVIHLSGPVCLVKLHAESGMLAVALDDCTISLIDLDTRRLVRKFEGHYGKITDLTFNPAGTWLISSSMDSTVLTWDLLTGFLIDRLKSLQVVTSMDMAPNGQFLAVSLLDEPGIFLWSNRSMYTHIAFKALTLDGEELGDLQINLKGQADMMHDLVMTSKLPDSKWANILKLDVIKYRNRVRVPVKPKKAAPFFLPTISGVDVQFDVNPDDEGEEGTQPQSKPKNFNPVAGLEKVLLDCLETGDPEPYIALMKSFSMTAVEAEIRLLSPDPGVAPDLMLAFLKVTRMALKRCKDYELVQSYLALCLKINNDDILNHDGLLEELQLVSEEADRSWSRLDSEFNKARCLVSYQRSAIL